MTIIPTHPYSNLPNHQFWRRAVSGLEHHLFDPVITPRFTFGAKDLVATAGSCFAQHISHYLRQNDFSYFVTETGDHLSMKEREQGQYGVFSARFGNIYTPRQLLQLFNEAVHDYPENPDVSFHSETAWQRSDGRWIDPYRPLVQSEGYASADEVVIARQLHLLSVSQMFKQADIFIFTLGLTEAWHNKYDGSVFPLAPGVAGGVFDATKHEAVNFTVLEVVHDLQTFIQALHAVNPCVKVLLTVSPVPLIATFEKRHVLVSNTYSKAVLRVAAQSIINMYSFVDYFPSYEIIAGSFNFGAYYQSDAREITPQGIAHVMRTFNSHYLVRHEEHSSPSLSITSTSFNVICDEEQIAVISV